jgi:hypothetical protein
VEVEVLHVVYLLPSLLLLLLLLLVTAVLVAAIYTVVSKQQLVYSCLSNEDNTAVLAE